MFSFSSWIISVAGGALLFGLLRLVSPCGKMAEFVSGVLNIFYMYIVVFPIIEYIKNII